MSGAAVEAVVLDVGNVLLEWAPERYYDRTIGEARRRALFAEVDLDGMNKRVDLGEGFRDVIYDMAERHPEWRAEIRDWHDSWIEMASPAIPRTVELMRALRSRGVPVYALTNFGTESFAFAQTRYDFLTEFDGAIVSGHLGFMKPDPRIYEAVERMARVAPERLMFTDDRADNIAAARARGWQVHLFEAPEGFAAALAAAGLLDPEGAGA
jgi:2-haloacid dehalogenase